MLGGALSGAIELGVQLIRWGVRATFTLLAITPIIGIVLFALVAINGAIDHSILGDIIGLIQIWAPLNINALLQWVFTATGMLFAVRVAMIAYKFSHELVGTS